MDRLEEAGAGEMRQSACIVVVGLVRGEQLQGLTGLPALDADNWQSELVQTIVQHRSHSAGLEYDPLAGWNLGQLGRNVRRRRRHLRLVDDTPLWVTTQICVSAIETSSPAKYSIV